MGSRKKKSSRSGSSTPTEKPLTATIEGDFLVVRIKMQEPRKSASGKTMVVASSRGNKETEAEVDGHPLYLGVNAYFYA